jgi:proteasome lid subunit RPN8/RPN11
MIIGKKLYIQPIDASEIKDARIQAIFDNRQILHAKKVPEFAVYIDELTWYKFLQSADNEYTQRKNEASGIFLGHYFADQFGRYTVGTHFEAGNGTSTSSVLCEISVNDQLRILQTARDQKLLQLIWVHSHPTFGAFYSAVDFRTLKSMYYAPHQAGIVVDNVNCEYLGFKTKDGKVHEFNDIYLVSLDVKTPNAFRPFEKNPRKYIDVKNIRSISIKSKPICQSGTKLRSHEMSMETEIIELLSNAIDDLRKIMSDSNNGLANLPQHQINWQIKVEDIETLLNEYFGDKPCKEISPCFIRLYELRLILKKHYSFDNMILLLDKWKEFSTSM